jgi:hypothetical protein
MNRTSVRWSGGSIVTLALAAACATSSVPPDGGTPRPDSNEAGPSTPEDAQSGAEAKEVPAFSLEDVNPSSPGHGKRVSPNDYAGSVSAWYFSAATCTYCRWQYTRLASLQRELDQSHPSAKIRFLAVNRAGYESGLDKLTPLGDLPILQDTKEEDAWHKWSIRYRDIVVLDAKGHFFGRFNLTDHDLGDESDYVALRKLLLRAAGTNE